jgi:hypothetical protein
LGCWKYGTIHEHAKFSVFLSKAKRISDEAGAGQMSRAPFKNAKPRKVPAFRGILLTQIIPWKMAFLQNGEYPTIKIGYSPYLFLPFSDYIIFKLR